MVWLWPSTGGLGSLAGGRDGVIWGIGSYFFSAGGGFSKISVLQQNMKTTQRQLRCVQKWVKKKTKKHTGLFKKKKKMFKERYRQAILEYSGLKVKMYLFIFSKLCFTKRINWKQFLIYIDDLVRGPSKRKNRKTKIDKRTVHMNPWHRFCVKQ